MTRGSVVRHPWLIATEEVRNCRKLYASKTFLKMAGWRMHIPHPTPLDSPLAISYKNHQNNVTYFSHLAPLVLFFFTKRQSQKGEGHGTKAPSKHAPEGRIRTMRGPRLFDHTDWKSKKKVFTSSDVMFSLKISV